MAMAGTGKVALLCELYSTVCTCWICTFFFVTENQTNKLLKHAHTQEGVTARLAGAHP